MERDELEIVCETSKPDVPVKWYKRGFEIVPGVRFKISQQGTKCILFIKSAILEDTAEYECKIVKSGNSTSGTLTVKGSKPERMLMFLISEGGVLC